jgi:hypothetical protein
MPQKNRWPIQPRLLIFGYIVPEFSASEFPSFVLFETNDIRDGRGVLYNAF